MANNLDEILLTVDTKIAPDDALRWYVTRMGDSFMEAYGPVPVDIMYAVTENRGQTWRNGQANASRMRRLPIKGTIRVGKAKINFDLQPSEERHDTYEQFQFYVPGKNRESLTEDEVTLLGNIERFAFD